MQKTAADPSRRLSLWKGGLPTATTYLKSHKRADKRTALQSLKDRFDYGLNPEKLGAVSSYLCDPATAHAEFMLVKNQYQGETDRRAGHGALCYQIRQAFPHGEVTAEEANRIGYETAMRWTKGKYQFFVCTHIDKEHIHNHIYYNSTAYDRSRKFRNFIGSSFALRRLSDRVCLEHDLSVIANPKLHSKGRYNYAKRESVKEGFVPVLIKADDEILWECLIMNSDPDSDGEDDFAFDPDKVAEYRKKMLSAPVENSKAVLEEMIGQRKEEAEDDDMDWDEEILGEMEGGYDNRRFSSYWNSDNNMTYPLILAKIPVKNPWEIFAYLPFGGWNECPNTPELMAVAKYWFEQHGAVPAAMSHDELEFLLPAPVPEEKAMDAAVELYGFCPDVIDQGPEDATVGALADVLRQSTVWYFWWD